MKKLFILEDDPNAMPIIEWLKNKNKFDVVHARTIEDAVYYLEYCPDKPIDSYSYFIFDASIPGTSVPSVNGERLEFFDNEGLNGVLIFKRYKEKIEKLGAKTAFMTAYSSQIKNRYDINNITIIDKASDGFIKELSEFIA